jgi:hypothetical protein
MVFAGYPAIGFGQPPRMSLDVFPIQVVVQRIEAIRGFFLRFGNRIAGV